MKNYSQKNLPSKISYNDIPFQRIIFSKEDCEYIRSFAKEFSYNIIEDDKRDMRNKYPVGYMAPRSVKKSLVNDERLNIFIKKKLNPYFKIKNIPFCSIWRYDEGDYFSNHQDHHEKKVYEENTKERYFSLFIQLSDTSEYDGGFLSTKDMAFNKNLGNVFLIKSRTKHQVYPVKSGTRYSLSMWLSKDDIEFNSVSIF